MRSVRKMSAARLRHPPESVHDDTLIEWFLSLQPIERLAELESRLAFFNTAPRDGDPELPPDTPTA